MHLSSHASTCSLRKLKRISTNSYSSNSFRKTTLPISSRLNSIISLENGKIGGISTLTVRKRISLGNGESGVGRAAMMKLIVAQSALAGVAKILLMTQIWSIAILSGWRRRDRECTEKRVATRMRSSMMISGMIRMMMTMVDT